MLKSLIDYIKARKAIALMTNQPFQLSSVVTVIDSGGENGGYLVKVSAKPSSSFSSHDTMYNSL